MNKELYVSTTPHETKVALVEDDQLAEVYFERENEYTLAGSIYKGRVTRVLPGMQSAFVDIGLERDAFLYVSDFLELQDEDEDGEFGDVKVTGATLAQANGLILAEPLAEEEDSEEPEEAPPPKARIPRVKKQKMAALPAGAGAAAVAAAVADATACPAISDAQRGHADSGRSRASRTRLAIPSKADDSRQTKIPNLLLRASRGGANCAASSPVAWWFTALARSVNEDEIEKAEPEIAG